MQEEKQNIFHFIFLFFSSIFHVIPFIIADLCYSYSSYDYNCIDNYEYSQYINIREWFMVTGYLSLASVLFILSTSVIIYTKTFLPSFLESPYFIKTYIFLRNIFSLSWNIIGIIILSRLYYQCGIGIRIYMIIRLLYIFLFIGLSIKIVREYIMNNKKEDDKENKENINYVS